MGNQTASKIAVIMDAIQTSSNNHIRDASIQLLYSLITIRNYDHDEAIAFISRNLNVLIRYPDNPGVVNEVLDMMRKENQ